MPEPATGDRAADLTRTPRAWLPLTARLAVADYRHEWVSSGCSILALAAVLIPLLVLFGLKYGIITNLLDPLIENPRYREIAPTTAGRYDGAWFDAMRARPDVTFVVPRTRSIAATIRLRAPQSEVGRIIDVELVPTAPGDPVLPEELLPPTGYGQAVLAWTAADKLGVQPGDRVEGLLSRTRRDSHEAVRVSLDVTGIAAVAAFGRDGLFVSTALISAVEDFLDGRAVPELGWDGTAPRDAERVFAGFRLYARSIEDVGPIRQALLDQDIEVRTSIADISLVQTLDRNLSVAYWIIALMAMAGFALSFATSVWANVERKQREFSVLRLTGFRTAQIVWFPILQAALTAVLAWLLASLVFLAVQALINALFAPGIGAGEPVCRLRGWHLIVALLITLLAAVAAASVGGRRVAQLEPSIGLRER
jgi:putative ABC transport system permease protein